ncbi:MAG: N-acetyltransferase [Oligoflexia bacterium]|nr:N-acetyltransferase [Oligoflexia bacterium]
MSGLSFVEFSPAENKREFKKFINLPWKIYKDDPAWVAPLKLTVLDNLDLKKNPFYKHAKICFWNAYKGKEHVGRIAAVVDERHNEFHNETTGFFGFFECINNLEVAKGLLSRAEAWLQKQGMTASRGPANPSFNHEVGLLVDNFKSPPFVMMTHNPPYYADLLEQAGYGKVKDLLAFNMDRPEQFDSRISKIFQKVKEKGNISFRPIDMKNFKEEVRLIKDIYNSAWEKNWGFVPMDDEEFDHMAKSLKDVMWPEFCMIAFSGKEPIGFSLSLPNINEVLINNPSGKLLPFGIFKLLKGLKPKNKKIRRVRVITLGVKPEFRRLGIAPVFYYEAFKAAERLGLDGGELSWILEDNVEMLHAIQIFAGVPPYKTYRILEKSL